LSTTLKVPNNRKTNKPSANLLIFFCEAHFGVYEGKYFREKSARFVRSPHSFPRPQAWHASKGFGGKLRAAENLFRNADGAEQEKISKVARRYAKNLQ
jgi:hypothetical protein